MISNLKPQALLPFDISVSLRKIIMDLLEFEDRWKRCAKQQKLMITLQISRGDGPSGGAGIVCNWKGHDSMSANIYRIASDLIKFPSVHSRLRARANCVAYIESFFRNAGFPIPSGSRATRVRWW